MLVDGRKISENILKNTAIDVALLKKPPRLHVITCEPTFETKKFIELKSKRAAEVGIEIVLTELDSEGSTQAAVMAVQQSVANSDGIVVQLPFPKRIDIEEVLTAIPPSHDADVLTYDGSQEEVLPPVVGAISAILDTHNIELKGKKVAVLGQGMLVGRPSVIWLKSKGADVTSITEHTKKVAEITKQADVVVTGVGKTGILTPKMIKEGVVIIDAGTSEQKGQLAGDVDPACEKKASLFTPVPGGVGPITVAILLRNVLRLAEQKR